jgi:hypothetical protein
MEKSNPGERGESREVMKPNRPSVRPLSKGRTGHEHHRPFYVVRGGGLRVIMSGIRDF